MSEIRVDTISEKTSANGVAIDGLTIKDGAITTTTGTIVFNEASANVDFRVESNDNENMLVVDGGDNDVRIGTATSFGPYDAGLKVKGDITIGDFTADSASGTLGFVKSRNTTVGSQTIVANGDEIGRIAFKADDGNDANYNNNVAAIAVQIDAAPGTDDTGGRIMFETTADGARVGTERMRITSSGKVGIAETNPQAKLSIGGHMSITATSRLYLDGAGDTFISEVSANEIAFTTGNSERMRISSDGLHIGGTGSANALDDYEEGTYAPTVTDENGGSYGLSTNSDTLQYTKIGRKVTLQGMIAVTSESSPNGTLRLSLPFTAPSLTDDTDFALYAMGISNNGSTIAGQKFLFVQPGAYAYLYAIGDDGATNYIQHDEVDTNFQFHVNLSYVVS